MGLRSLAIRALDRGVLEFNRLRWEITRHFRGSVTVSTRQGVFTVLTGADESIGRTLYCTGQYELDLMSKTMAFLRSIDKCPQSGGVIVDVGANNGVISVGMLYTREFARAIAIEPEPRNFALLERNVDQNGLKDKVICLPYAASYQKGEIQLELSRTNSGDHRVRLKNAPLRSPQKYRESTRDVISVQAERIDDILAAVPEEITRGIALAWVDVQGFEGHVFMGGERLFSSKIPVVAEIWPYGASRAGIGREQFSDIARRMWTDFWVLRGEVFDQYPIDAFDQFWDQLDRAGRFGHVIFAR